QTKETPSNNTTEISDGIEEFLALRGNLREDIFKGPELSGTNWEEIRTALKDDNLFVLWKTFYNQNLRQMAIENPELIKKLIDLSNFYENTLPSQMKSRFPGTNPLYAFTMENLSGYFTNALKSGQTVEQAMTETGKKMFEYHKRIYQIQIFLNMKKKPKFMNWHEIRKPRLYQSILENGNDQGLGNAGKFGFGILVNRRKDLGVRINNEKYPEYYDDVSNKYQHVETYNGVSLSKLKNIDNNGAFILYPTIGEGTISNNTLAFQAMQKNWEVIKDIIEKHDHGKVLDQKDIEKLHTNVAEMSYIFCNAVPFHRGTSALNLVMVYGLYQAAGIKASQVKIGRALDLSAFVMTPEQYIKEWKTLFKKDFVVQPLMLTNIRTANQYTGQFSKHNIAQPSIIPKRQYNFSEMFYSALPFILPAAALGLSFAFKGLDIAGTGLALAAIPIIGVPSKEAIEQDEKIQKFIYLRKNFDVLIFKGDDLTSEEADNLKRILGEDFFYLWQKYYNKDLKEMARENPQDLLELAKYSNRYESTLPSEIGTRFNGT
ncbi:MAG: hypothetical protein J6S61_01015, partial [Elusimicrobiaceae bacterium]|nr:hypothetical protein [Elusimicrobiaceae bacterium]